MTVLNPGGGGTGVAAFASGTAASRPAASGANANTGYYATDTGEVTISNGAAWQQIGAAGNSQLNVTGNMRAGNAVLLNGVTGQLAGTAAIWQLGSADFDVQTAGKGLRVAEGANAKQGVATLVAGTVTVANTSVTATSRILISPQEAGTLTGFLRVSARTAGTSFTVSSSVGTDTVTFAWEIFEVG